MTCSRTGVRLLPTCRWCEQRQLVFDRLMLDQRTKEGMFIQRLKKMVEEKKVNAESIKASSPTSFYVYPRSE